MSTLFAGIHLLENPYAIDGVFDYAVPPALEGEIRTGCFVTVPFGTANRPKFGLVTELRDRSAYPDAKFISSVCPDNLSLDGEMLGLCDFMKRYTLCTVGDAVRAMIPSSALGKVTTVFSLRENVKPDPDDAILNFIAAKNGNANAEEIRREFGLSSGGKLRRLVADGVLSREILYKDANAEKNEKRYRCGLSKEVLEGAADCGRLPGMRALTDSQKAVLSLYLSDPEPKTAAEIKTGAGTTDAPISTLVKHGILTEEFRRIDRNPYVEIDYTGETPISLNEEQSVALQTLSALADAGKPSAALLFGVTGSGKTCVMAALMDKLLKEGRGVILLLPEIALTPQSVAIFCARYGTRVAVIHSALSAGERYDAYCRIREGKADVVIGTRSAVFAPVKNLGAIIIDEEQEHTYKSDQDPKYHARDIARYRCAQNNALMLLASATPSLESYKKAEDGVYTLVKLKGRYGSAVLPEVQITDMRKEVAAGNLSPLGENLVRRIGATVEAKNQAILFLNRRGYNHFVSCRSCGEAILCPGCSVAMTYHTRKGTYQEGDLVCHWCGRRMQMPKTCPACGSEHLAKMGFGTQKAEEELTALYPTAKVLRMDTDTVGSKFAYDEMLGKFRSHEADVLLGTQMVTKGHDFPDVTLVGVLSADSSLYLDDYRAGERTFAMLTQVIGRAGRSQKKGLAVIQTSNPDSEVIRLACAQDYEGFYQREIRLRKLLTFPPFCDIALVTLTGSQESELLKVTALFANRLKSLSEGEYKDVPLMVFGPFEASVYRVDNRYRMRTVVKCRINKRTLSLFETLMNEFSGKIGKNMTIGTDFNPSGL